MGERGFNWKSHRRCWHWGGMLQARRDLPLRMTGPAPWYIISGWQLLWGLDHSLQIPLTWIASISETQGCLPGEVTFFWTSRACITLGRSVSAPCTARSVQAGQSAGSLTAPFTEEAAWSGLWQWRSLKCVSATCLQRQQRRWEGLGALRKPHFTLLPIWRNKNSRNGAGSGSSDGE